MKSLLGNGHVAGVLPYIAAFHSLKWRHERGEPLSWSQGKTLRSIREMFEPQRITARGTHREPLCFPVHRSARIVFGGQLMDAELLSLSLRGAEVTWQPPSAPLPGTHVLIEIENAAHDTWFPFVARVARVEKSSGHAAFVLERPLKRHSVR
jgi:hypothetical protein